MFNRICKLTCLAALFSVSAVSLSYAGGLNVNVDIGVPAPVPPPPVYVPAPPPPVSVPPPVVLPATPPQFVFVPELGYYVAVGTPYDIAYIGNEYYMYNNGYWYRTAYYGGPLVRIERRMWPPLLVRHNVKEFRRFREVEFRRYDRDREHYRGQLHRPEVKREERRDLRDVRKEERRDMRRDERREEERR